MTIEIAEELGSASHGTLRSRDLLEYWSRFLKACVAHAPDHGANERSNTLVAQVEEFVEQNRPRDVFDYDEHIQENAIDLILALEAQINEYAPEDYYFGPHEGDGSDYGFWRITE